MKKGIILYAYGSNSWIGGLYYIKNIAFMLSNNHKFIDAYNIYIFVEEKNIGIFSDLSDKVNIIVKTNKEDFENKLFLFGFYLKNRIKYLFPASDLSLFPTVKSIAWIPDFQHNYLTNMFSEDELKKRTEEYTRVVNDEFALVVSSQTSKKDFEKFYSNKKKYIEVVRFVSYIEPEIKSITSQCEIEILEKYGLSNLEYIYIGNQFWKHKNHIVVLKAIRFFLSNNPNNKVRFVFTGKMNDYRNPEYSKEIIKIFSGNDIRDYVVNLGFLERKEQLVIMKNAQFLIQPSLFEGWGTVVEDAKVLDKTVLLSDIPIHREQKSSKCILFQPDNEKQLAELIEEQLYNKRYESIEDGIADMYQRAREYSEGFLRLLEKFK